MMKFSVVCLVVVAVHLLNVEGLTKDEKKALFEIVTPLVATCTSYCNLSDDDMKKYQQGDDVPPCIKQCIMTAFGLLDEDGKYDRAVLYESISQFTDDKDKAQKIEEKIDSCFKANGDNDGDDEESIIKRVDVMLGCLKKFHL